MSMVRIRVIISDNRVAVGTAFIRAAFDALCSCRGPIRQGTIALSAPVAGGEWVIIADQMKRPAANA